MKYMVMEIHNGYAVLMGEDSSFAFSANMGYKVGQTVSDPILMEKKEPRTSRNIIIKVAAAAACLAIACCTGYHLYSVNYKTSSTLIVSASAEVKLYINKKDKVISTEILSPDGEELLSGSDLTGKDKNEAVRDILELSKSKGYISDGDTVSVYISGQNGSSDSLKKELEQELSGLSIAPEVRSMDEYTKPQAPPAPAEEEKPAVPKPPAPGHEAEDKAPDPPSPEKGVSAPEEPEKPAEPDAPPAPAPEAPAAANDAEPAAPEAPADHDDPAPPGEDAPPPPPEAPGNQPPHEIRPPLSMPEEKPAPLLQENAPEAQTAEAIPSGDSPEIQLPNDPIVLP